MIMSRTIIAIPPGYTIREQLEQRGMTQKEFALRMDMSEKHISRLINGEVRLTPNVSIRLESILGIPSEFWNNLEAIYQSKKQQVEEENAMDADREILKNIPYAEMVKLGWIKEAESTANKVKNLRCFFEVAFLTLIERISMIGVAYRKLGSNKKSKYVLSAWIQQARIEARKREVSSINIEKLSLRLSDIRKLTLIPSEEFMPKLSDILSGCGVALVVLPALKGSFLHGASFIDGKKIVLALTLRGKYADKFWFSLFHEIYHILEGHMNKADGLTEEEEGQADRFSEDILISREEYNNFVKEDNFTLSSVKELAGRVKIDTGILVSRLQKDDHINFNEMNFLRKKILC